MKENDDLIETIIDRTFIAALIIGVPLAGIYELGRVAKRMDAY